MSRFKQGLFTPKHPEKYIGRVDSIHYRSSWELYMHNFLDNNPNVLKWSSEEIAIPYVKPTDRRVHKYYVDYYVEYVDTTGKICIELVEVKPKTQTSKPRANHKHRLYEQLTYAVNQAKWAAAKQFAESRGWKFRIVTEKGLYR